LFCQKAGAFATKKMHTNINFYTPLPGSDAAGILNKLLKFFDNRGLPF